MLGWGGKPSWLGGRLWRTSLSRLIEEFSGKQGWFSVLTEDEYNGWGAEKALSWRGMTYFYRCVPKRIFVSLPSQAKELEYIQLVSRSTPMLTWNLYIQLASRSRAICWPAPECTEEIACPWGHTKPPMDSSAPPQNIIGRNSRCLRYLTWIRGL